MMYRAVRPQAAIAGRSVILTDDGIATGATMIASLRTVRAAGAKQIVVAVPVGAAIRIPLSVVIEPPVYRMPLALAEPLPIVIVPLVPRTLLAPELPTAEVPRRSVPR